MARKHDDILSELQIVLAEKILEKIKAGEDVTAADWNVARQLLKDNQIQAPPGANSALDELKKTLKLPSFPDEDQLPA